MFFPVGSTGPAEAQVEQAKQVCARCPVVQECLQWALEAGAGHGVWGGLTEQERRLAQRRLYRLDDPDRQPAKATSLRRLSRRPDPSADRRRDRDPSDDRRVG